MTHRYVQDVFLYEYDYINCSNLEITLVQWPEFMIIQYPTFQATIMPTMSAHIAALLLLLS